jgi:23S rRNA maturation mini-RNase III
MRFDAHLGVLRREHGLRVEEPDYRRRCVSDMLTRYYLEDFEKNIRTRGRNEKARRTHRNMSVVDEAGL